MTPADVVTEFTRFLIDNGALPQQVIADGKWHSLRMADTRGKASKPGRYILHADERPIGWLMDWRNEKQRHVWRAGGVAQSLGRDEVLQLRADAHRKRQAAYSVAADKAAEFWRGCTGINGRSHPYLDRKGIGPNGARYGSGKPFGLGDVECLVIPLSGAEGEAMSLQAIREDGERRFWPGSTHEGAHLLVGKDDGKSPVVFCEGFATAASLHSVTGWPVVMCVTSANMRAVGRWAGHKYAGRELIVAGDDDWHLVDHPQIRRNVGKEEAQALAKAIGGRLIMPDMHGLATSGGDDFNDMLVEYGGPDVLAIVNEVPANLQAHEAPEYALPLEWFEDIEPSLAANWLVDDLIPAGGLCLIYGHPGSGKSFFALDLTMHIAGGLQWRGRECQPGLVIYVGAEGQRGLRQRISAFRQHHKIASLPFALIPVEVNMLDAEGDVEKLAATIEVAARRYNLPVAMIVLDTLSRTFGGGDEVGPDMVTYINNGGKLQQRFNCAQLDIHHRPKDSANETPRGHGSLWGACDTIILVEDRNGQKSAKVTKQKDAEPGEPIDFNLHVVDLGHDEKGRAVTSCVVVKAEQSERVTPDIGWKFSDEQKIALRVLYETVDQTGGFMAHEVPQNRLPKGPPVKVARLSEWVVRTGAALASPDKQPDSVRRAIQRYQNKFQALNIIGVYDEWVWACRDIRTGPDKPGQVRSDTPPDSRTGQDRGI